ncbi:hypothetical protein EUX98_g1841 [Antrodiella citrinella]|uniref:Uncharacterized protein n=1 Tax=Antrodiella citrinella TaxID=2447956 RepID=A0A4S4N2P5_9APHY|nr:hypothetical protein EUX98_g1841 [Antrodiella citrinella]
MSFSKGASGLTELADEDDPQQDALEMAESQDALGTARPPQSEADMGGWLDDDDIEDA